MDHHPDEFRRPAGQEVVQRFASRPDLILVESLCWPLLIFVRPNTAAHRTLTLVLVTTRPRCEGGVWREQGAVEQAGVR